MKALAAALLAGLFLAGSIGAQEEVSFPAEDGGVVYAIAQGKGDRGVVLAHGGRFLKESWAKQASALAEAGFRSVAIDYRGEGKSRAGPKAAAPDQGRHLDVLAAVRYLRMSGAKSVSVVGASMGGDFGAEAAEARPAAIDRLVLLAAGAYTTLLQMKGRKLYILCRDDVMGENQPRMPKIREQYERAVGPKEFIILEGSAHAQFIFATDQDERLMREILRFLTAP